MVSTVVIKQHNLPEDWLNNNKKKSRELIYASHCSKHLMCFISFNFHEKKRLILMIFLLTDDKTEIQKVI